ncbi:MAG: divalent-cation tolerance protein CutA [Verrucomicrobiae bacterium]
MIRIVLSTFPDEEAAAKAVRALVSENLAACGTLLPGARSIYRWEGKIEDASEVVAIFKISAANEKSFAARLLELHPYDVPEMVFLTPSHVHEAYAQWVVEKNDPADGCDPGANAQDAGPLRGATQAGQGLRAD